METKLPVGLRRETLITLVFAALLASAGAAFGTGECRPAVGHVASAQGEVEIRRAGEPEWRAAQLGAPVCAGDSARAQRFSRAALQLINQTALRLDQNTELTLSGGEGEAGWLIDLLRGAIHALTRTPQPIKVNTPYANAGVEGTEFTVGVGAGKARVAALEGKVVVSNEAGLIRLLGGETLLVAQNMAPRLESTIQPADTVHWASYYPAVLDQRRAAARGGPAEPAVRESDRLKREGRLAEAIVNMDQALAARADPASLTYRAGLLLEVGRAEEARADLDRALRMDPAYADALALQAVIAVTQNDTEGALALARRAVEQGKTSPAAHLALSYVQQAQGRVEDAQTSAATVVELDTDSALAWARLAELHLATARLDDALAAAQRAQSLDPDLAKTHSVLGFAQLVRMDTAAAARSFNRAIELDEADPQPRLGLGLARIRAGDLVAGRENIETAASLDPLNALIRSYLGKAYYDERRNALAETQYQLARDFDPLDPTPWFYDAIRKRAENRPVEALADLQQSVERNDNRAVYRSRLLLDEDLAARNARQGRLYRGLGFERLALPQAFDSLATDPGNFSAHRLLADAHLAQPRHEVARASELLQAQLTQPANLAPLQLLSAESDLFLLDQGGLRNPGFGEYDPLFMRDRVAGQVSLRAGSNDTLAHDLAMSAIRGPVSFSVAHSRLSTDGIRANDDLTQDAYGAFIQGSLSPSTTLQAEVRKTAVRHGDRALAFDPAQFLPNLRENWDADFARVGFRHAFSPGSELLGSLSFRDYRSRTSNQGSLSLASIVPGVSSFSSEQEVRQRGTLVELQHLLRLQNGNLTSGGGFYRAKAEQATDTFNEVAFFPQTTLLPAFPPFLPFPSLITFTPPPITTRTVLKSKGTIKHANLHSYYQLQATENTQLTLGLSADDFQEDISSVERHQINPKFGLVWKAAPQTTLRIAAFRTLRRALTGNQTLEPTQVAGFTQFFDDINGTDARGAGIAVDQSFSRRWFAGLSYSGRDLRVPDNGTETGTGSGNLRWDERKADAYLYWLMGSRVAASAAAEYAAFDRGRDTRHNPFTELRTLKTPFSLAYFEPNRFSARVTATQVRQRGTFVDIGDSLARTTGKERFWVTDLSLDLMLPKRIGSVGIAVLNAFDRKFHYFQDIDPTKPAQRDFEPGRRVFLKLDLAL